MYVFEKANWKGFILSSWSSLICIERRSDRTKKQCRKLIITMSQQESEIFNFAFLDLETTGLPYAENNRTRITELSICVVESRQIRLGVYPRVQNKLNLCVNPCKFISPGSTEITGLANDILENQSPLTKDVISVINDFLSLQKKPICLVAHNGFKFDFPILKAEMDRVGVKLNDGLFCIDSLIYFRESHKQHIDTSKKDAERKQIVDVVTKINCLDEVDTTPHKKQKIDLEFTPNILDEEDKMLCQAVDAYEENKHHIQKILEKTPEKQTVKRNNLPSTSLRQERVSFKLGDIYKRLTNKDPTDSHHAEGDVNCLIHCAAVEGDEFVDWANLNCKLLEDIPTMRPGVRIGF